MRIITYASHYSVQSDNYNKYIERAFNALKDKLDIEPLDSLGGNFQLYHKIIAVNNYIKNLDDNEFIVFVDAFDVLPVNGVNRDRLEYAIQKTYNMNKITFNSEINCSPQSDLAKYFQDIPGEWKYLNSGMYAGRVKLLKPFFDNIITYIDKLPKDVETLYDVFGDQEQQYNKFNDQLICIQQYIKNNSSIDLDYNCNVFQTLYSGHFFSHPYHKLHINYENKTIQNTVTGSYPLLVHGNGKTILDRILDIV